MRVTDPHGDDWDVQLGTPISAVRAAWQTAGLYCGPLKLSDDHVAGIAPFVDGASLTERPGPYTSLPSGPHVVAVRGPDAGVLASLSQPLVVGSGRDADLRVNDPAVSREHARVEPGARPRLVDLGSTNGIGTRWRRTRTLVPHAAVELGHTWLELRGAAPPTTDRRASRHGFPWTTIIGALVSGIVIAVLTGRWYLALIGLALPATVLATRLVARMRSSESDEHIPELPSGTVAVRGAPDLARGYARALMVERGTALPDWDEPWTRWLPPAPADSIVLLEPGQPSPSWCDTTVDVAADHTSETSDSGVVRRPALAMSASTADAAARRIAAQSQRDALPAAVRWAQLRAIDTRQRPGKPRSMRVAIGVDRDGDFCLDLDHHGPHLLVAGTTGSGKSVLLETLVAGLAHAHSPADLHLALMDFKGGAGLRACLDLPHVAATVTDLDEEQARRALAGLALEVAERKQTLAGRGYSSLAQWEAEGGAPPRLLVVIDEYQEISLRMRDFVPELARIAAQGRSLGLHLVLATQRPSGAVTPEVRANIGTSVALRVRSEAESRDVIATASAAHLPRSAPGRAIVAGPEAQIEIHTAIPTVSPVPPVRRVGATDVPGSHLAEAAAARWSECAPAPHLWCPPLPSTLAPLPRAEGFDVGLRDDPARRRQHRVLWRPSDGPLVIVGPARSGKTSALNAIASQAHHHGLVPVWLPTDPREAARTLAVAATRTDILLIVDGGDAAVTKLSKVDDGGGYEALTDRLALGLPTALAGGASTPARVGQHAAIVCVLAGTDRQHATTWGVPRDALAALGDTVRPGRCFVREPSGSGTTQLTAARASENAAVVAPLPHRPVPDVWGVGGDDCSPVTPPDRAVVVGPGGPLRDAVQASLGPHATALDLATMATPGSSIILTAPRPRDVRMLVRSASGGLVDPVPVPGRVVLIADGVAKAVQLGSRVVGHLFDGVEDDSHARPKAYHNRGHSDDR